MKLIHALLNAAKAAFTVTGNAPAALAVTGADAALTLGEAVLEKIHATKATPADTVFISTPDSMTPAQFRDAHRVIAHAVSTARSRQETLPKIIVLPPGSWAGIEQGRVQA